MREVNSSDKKWIINLLNEHWGSAIIVSRGKMYDASLLPGLVAIHNSQTVGLITYHIENQQCEIVTLNSLVEGIGVGTLLINAVKEKAVQSGYTRLWLITTNDNTAALRYYQKRGFRLAALHKNAIEQSRKLKPQIPELGIDNIAIQDEIELEMMLVEEV